MSNTVTITHGPVPPIVHWSDVGRVVWINERDEHHRMDVKITECGNPCEHCTPQVKHNWVRMTPEEVERMGHAGLSSAWA